MDVLTRLFLESRLLLAGFSLLLFGAAYVLWIRWEGPGRRRLLPGALLLVVSLFVVQSAVRTTRERIMESLDALIRAVDREDARAIAASFAPDYAAEGMDRDAVLAFIEHALSRVDVFDVRIGQCDVRIDGTSAEMVLSAVATVRIQGSPSRLPSRWRVGWRRGPSGWQVSSLHPERVAGMPVRRLQDLRP